MLCCLHHGCRQRRVCKPSHVWGGGAHGAPDEEDINGFCVSKIFIIIFVKTKYIDYVIPLSNKVNLTNHHPVFHTMLLGTSIKIGRLFGSDNFGLFLYAIMQSITLASSLACTISYLYKKNKSVSLALILLAIYSLVPMFPF